FGEPTVHVVGVRETHYFGHDAPITWNLPGDHRLVLYTQVAAAQWAIELGPQGELDEVHVFDGGVVSAPMGVTVVEHGALNPAFGACSEVPKAQEDDCRAEALRDAAELALSTDVHSVDYCYEAQHFEFEPTADCGGTPGATAPECGAQTGASGSSQATCDGITAESVHCALAASDGVVLFGLDSGDYCDIAAGPGGLDIGFGDGGLGWIGDDLYFCNDNVNVFHTDDGTTEDSGFPCQMVTDYQGGILVRPGFGAGPFDSGDAVHFAGWAELVAQTPLATYDIDGFFGLTMATDGDQLYTGWFHAAKAERWDIPTGVQQADAPFGCWDGWVGGVDVLDGSTYVFADNEGLIKVFDAVTGDFEGQVDVPFGPSLGVACRAAP
ncbi:MAG: hypothetical protein AAF721_35940, partial [Myxococcota bacterium]